MEDAAGRAAASTPGTTADKDAREALEFDWGDAYLMGRDERGWWAARRDRIGVILTAPGPEELRAAIREEYAVNPVPRDIPAGDESR
jgi:hypothetical protein